MHKEKIVTGTKVDSLRRIFLQVKKSRDLSYREIQKEIPKIGATTLVNFGNGKHSPTMKTYREILQWASSTYYRDIEIPVTKKHQKKLVWVYLIFLLGILSFYVLRF